jgi:hypothetical protein
MQRRPQGRRVRKTYVFILQTRGSVSNHRFDCRMPKPEARSPPYPSFALIEIFALSTFDTGQPFSAASAYF